MNNPPKYTEPTGEIVPVLLAGAGRALLQCAINPLCRAGAAAAITGVGVGVYEGINHNPLNPMAGGTCYVGSRHGNGGAGFGSGGCNIRNLRCTSRSSSLVIRSSPSCIRILQKMSHESLHIYNGHLRTLANYYKQSACKDTVSATIFSQAINTVLR